VLDTQTLTIHRYTLNSTEVLNQLLRFCAAEKPMLAFSPGGTQFVVANERDRPEELHEARYNKFMGEFRRGLEKAKQDELVQGYEEFRSFFGEMNMRRVEWK
jgi:hypothetical protein